MSDHVLYVVYYIDFNNNISTDNYSMLYSSSDHDCLYYKSFHGTLHSTMYFKKKPNRALFAFTTMILDRTVAAFTSFVRTR